MTTYASENEPKYPEYMINNIVFVPKDISTLTLIDCSSQKVFFKNVFNMYAKDGSVVQNASPATFADEEALGIHQIKKNGLQDKNNKRNINADAALKKVFAGKDVVNMFEMTKLVSKHLS